MTTKHCSALRLLLGSLVALTLPALTGCRRAEAPASTGPTVALVMKTLNNPFFIDMQRGAKAAAKRLGVNLIVQAAEREIDVERQMEIVEDLIQRKVSALCIAPSGSKEIVPAIVEANKAGIPVLIIDTRTDMPALKAAGGRIVTFIGSDNVEGGRIAGRYMVKLLGGKGKVAILEGIPGAETSDARLKGFHEAIVSHPGIEVVASQTANWERDQGYNVCQNILQAHPDVQGIFACNDLMALGAVQAIAAAGKQGQVRVIGFDATEDGRKAIHEGTMAGSVAQHPEEMGRLAVENALDVIRGKPVPPEIPVKVELITRKAP